MKAFFFRIATVLATAALAVPVGAVETELVDLREGVETDGAVRLWRESGRLWFSDTTVVTPVDLLTLVTSAGDHGDLTGLEDDDHPQYLNTSRHASAHTATFNGAMAVPPDVAGNATLGAHLDDSEIHLGRSVAEDIAGRWTFLDGLEAAGTGIRVLPGPLGTQALSFSDTPFDATVRYVGANDRFEVNRPFYADLLVAPGGQFSTASVTTSLSGLSSSSVRSGAISGFVSIEGIAHSNLLSRIVDESIAGAWSFGAPVTIESADAGLDSEVRTLAVAAEATLAGVDPIEDRTRSAVQGAINVVAQGEDSMAGTLVAGVEGTASIDATSYETADGLVTGVWGHATSAKSGVLSAGVVGVASATASGTTRVGVLGGLDPDEARAGTAVAAGDWAGAFVGDVFVSGVVRGRGMALQATNDSGGTIAAGEAVAWTGAFTVDRAPAVGSATGAIAGVALADADDGDPVLFLTAGLIQMVASGTFSPGEALQWDGSSVSPAGSGAGSVVGTAIQGRSGGGLSVVWVQVRPGFVP